MQGGGRLFLRCPAGSNIGGLDGIFQLQESIIMQWSQEGWLGGPSGQIPGIMRE